MRYFQLPVLGLIFFAVLCACVEYKEQDKFAEPFYVLKGVHVIPIQPAGVLRDQTLLIRGQRIVAMGPSHKMDIPENAVHLAVKNKFVMPGLSDMHVHLDGYRDLLIMLRHGVTRVRNLSENSAVARAAGAPVMPELKQEVERGEAPGPQLYNCGPILDGDPPQHALTRVIKTREDAFKAVKYTHDKGFDCVKVYNHLSSERYADILEASQKYRLPVLGHVPYAVNWEQAIDTMKSIEHLSGYVDSHRAVYRVPPETWAAALSETAQSGVFHCPTLALWDMHPAYDELDKVKKSPRYKYVPPMTKLLWEVAVESFYDMEYASKSTYRARMLGLTQPLTLALHQAGSPLLIGTDTNMTGVFPGVATLREMNLFVEAGISNQDVLRIATWNAARYFGDTGLYGSVAPGKMADLLILDKNPLVNMQHIETMAGVFVQGKWWSRANLDQKIADSLSS